MMKKTIKIILVVLCSVFIFKLSADRYEINKKEGALALVLTAISTLYALARVSNPKKDDDSEEAE
jgi:hypothetical protein